MMTRDQNVPPSYTVMSISGELAIVCPDCSRAWRYKPPLNEENWTYLVEHRLDHRKMERRPPSSEIFAPPD